MRNDGLAVVVLVAATGVLALGCDQECDDDIVPWSVTVLVQNADGDPIRADSVTYSVEGEPFRECVFEGTYQCGYDRTGRFVIRVDVGGEVTEVTRLVGRDPNNCIRSETVRVTDTRTCSTSDGGCP